MKNKYGKELTFKFLKRLFKVTVLYTICFIIFYIVGYHLCSNITWYSDDPLYVLLTGIFYQGFFLLIIWFIGFIVIFTITLMKSLSYIDALVSESRKLITKTDEKIKLPDELKEAEETMNQIKKEALFNERLAKENEQKKNDLIVYLAHDLKTPLTSIIGYLSLLDEEKNLSTKQKNKFIKIALEKSNKLEELINELFEITKYNSETLTIKKEKLNLTLLINQVIDEFYPILKEQNKEINFSTQKDIFIKADSIKMARVFNNLIKNAINYSYDNSKINITIKEDKDLIITISNKSKTLSQEQIDKIFDKFYRIDYSRNTKLGGSGLGLAIAKEIIKAHNGKIQVKSENEETTFTITLPKN